MSVSRKHELFIQGILDGLSQTDAYIRAGYSARGARANASRLITNDSIQQAIQECRNELRSQSMLRLSIACESAVNEIIRIMEHGTNNDSCKLKAAQEVLNRVWGKPRRVSHSRNAPDAEPVRIIFETIERGKSGSTMPDDREIWQKR